jgi:hypothetical protein
MLGRIGQAADLVELKRAETAKAEGKLHALIAEGMGSGITGSQIREVTDLYGLPRLSQIKRGRK